MAVSIQSRSRGRYRPLAEINVTPMVDVMLVLLIIFMVAAPLMTSGVNVDLPKANASAVSQDSEPLTVSVNAENKVFLGEEEVQLPDLVARLQTAAGNQPDRRIFVRGDRGIQYGRVIEVMGTIIQGGFTKVALLTEGTPNNAPASAASGAAPSGAPAPGAPVPATARSSQPSAATPAPARRPGRG